MCERESARENERDRGQENRARQRDRQHARTRQSARETSRYRQRTHLHMLQASSRAGPAAALPQVLPAQFKPLPTVLLRVVRLAHTVYTKERERERGKKRASERARARQRKRSLLRHLLLAPGSCLVRHLLLALESTIGSTNSINKVKYKSSSCRRQECRERTVCMRCLLLCYGSPATMCFPA